MESNKIFQEFQGCEILCLCVVKLTYAQVKSIFWHSDANECLSVSFFTKFRFDLFCRDKNSQVTISSVTDRSDSVNSSYRCFNKRGSKTHRNSPGRHGLGKSSRVDLHLLGGGNNGWTMRGRVCHMTMFIVRKISCFLLVKKA